jgi:uncharacterized membrane protein
VLVAIMTVYVVVFGRLTWNQHANFGTYGFDMGIFDQGIWLLSRFREPFVTVRGLNYFGNHSNYTTVLFVPLYWLGAGPQFLLAVETVAIAAGAIPVWLLTRDRLGNEWLAVAMAAAYLLYPAFEWINRFQFHPDPLGIVPLLFAYWFATRKRWVWFAACVALVLLTKEDQALAVFMLGLVVAVRWNRRVGTITALAAAAYFALATRVLIPAANGGLGPFYSELYPGWGNSVFGIAFGMVRHPSRLLSIVWEHHRLAYYLKLLAPLGFLPLLSPLTLLIGLPGTAINIASSQPYTYDIRFQYTAMIGAAAFLAAIEAIALFRKLANRVVLVELVLLCALVGNILWSPSPLSINRNSSLWTTHRSPFSSAAVALIPRNARVTATFYLVPHLTHRRAIYEFPNPFIATNWGVPGSRQPDPADVDYVVVDRRNLTPPQQDLLKTLLEPQGAFVVIGQEGPITVARRQPP